MRDTDNDTPKNIANENAAEICKKCPGYCCICFAATFQKKDLDLKEEDHKRMNKIFRRVKNPFNREYLHHGSKAAYICTVFDWKKGACGEYDKRPQICKDYLCPSARQGRKPKKREFEIQVKLIRKRKKGE